ncbi:GMC oxidoreductase, partial [Burkholderia sp. Se-20378]|uniref:GMC oxidoreductase n=1 Tax=Burkholderia sp. Se-20378 TaxID=2703899 RepID=UPI001EC7AFE9
TLTHPVGTCGMGAAGDAGACVDTHVGVRGVSGLRVVDGSAIPRIIRGPTNALIMMMAERAADFITRKVVPKSKTQTRVKAMM